MIIPYVAFQPFSWLARIFRFLKERLKRIRLQQAISLAGGTIAVYLIYRWFTSDDKQEYPPVRHKHRRTYSSPGSSGSYMKQGPSDETSSEEGYNADPNYINSSIYKQQQKALRNSKNSDIEKKQAEYETNRSLQTLKFNYEKGLIPMLLNKSRHSISGSLKALFRKNGDPSQTLEKSNEFPT